MQYSFLSGRLFLYTPLSDFVGGAGATQANLYPGIKHQKAERLRALAYPSYPIIGFLIIISSPYDFNLG